MTSGSSEDILPPVTVESIDPELVQNIYSRMYFALCMWLENGLEPKYIQLNKSAYAAYYLRCVKDGIDIRLPYNTTFQGYPIMMFQGYPVILDVDSARPIEVYGSECFRAEEIKKMTRKNILPILKERYRWHNWGCE